MIRALVRFHSGKLLRVRQPATCSNTKDEMRALLHRRKTTSTRRQLALLLLAAMAFVAVLLGAYISQHHASAVSITHQHLSLLGIVTIVGGIAGVVVWQIVSAARRDARYAHAENNQLRRNLAAADAIITAEPQVLVFWEQGQAVRVVSHTLTGIPGLPDTPAELLRFGNWLESDGAESLKAGLDDLFAHARSFNTILRTEANGTLEAEGRTVGGRAVLRFKDVTGYKKELAEILRLHAHLSRDIRSSRALLDAVPMPVWLRGTDGRLTWVNAAYVTAVDAETSEEVLNQQIELLERRQRKAAMRQLASGGSYREKAHLVISGERKPHDIVVLPIEGATAGAAIDITAIETVQGELERQIAAYDKTLDKVETAVAIFNRDQMLVFFNNAYQALWQLDRDWLENHPSASDVLDRLREQGKIPPVVNYREWKSRMLACYVTGTPLQDEWQLNDGRILNVIGEQRQDGGVTYLFVDQTERLAMERRYNALIDVQRETLDSLKEGVAVFGTDGRLKLFNAALSEVWHVAIETLNTFPHIEEVLALFSKHHQDADTWARIQRAITAFDDGRQLFEGQMTRSDGTVIDYAMLPLPDGASLLTFADVTGARLAEKALVERNEALVAADKLKTNFIGHISYELRTPLNSIIGFTDMLASPVFGDLNDKQREYLTDIMSSSKTLLAIINDILDLTTIDAGGMELKLAPVGVRTLIDAAVLGVRERAIRARLTIDIAVADDISEVMADETRMRQVLYNLLSNAVGFSKPNSTVQMTCWREDSRVWFEVRDFGVGIPKDQMDVVFERFESHSQGSKHRGAGLGLSVAKSLVELHGGDIVISSEEDRGTQVTVSIPERQIPNAPHPKDVDRVDVSQALARRRKAS